MTFRIAALLTTLMLAVPARADSLRNCRTDSGGNRICVERERQPNTSRERRCTTTCRMDSGGHQVCREHCR
jgi:hypothetical protein